MIPDWMKEINAGPCECSVVYHGKKSFIGRTIEEIFEFIETSFIAESYSRRKGLLQSLDPRIKLISIIAVVFATALVANLRILILVYFLSALIAYLSKIEVRFFIKRVWLFIPIFSAIIVLPMIFNIFFPGDPLIQLIYLGPGAHIGPFPLPESVYITRQGVYAASVFIMRVATCVSAIVLLFLTTPQQMLFKSVRSVGVPKIYVLTLGMTYRYIFLLTSLVREMYIAKRARTITSRSMFEEQKWVGGRIGYTLMRSLDISEKVHMAMISRGFNGDFKTMEEFKMRKRDYIAGAASLALSIVLVATSQNIFRWT
ncbi:Transmembrane component NikQ of energizing module of nickel ECF transporter [Methanosarcina siciliae T4/M]|uniref:Transmembrane component NikQ of energizing module of nickel ECF transporter n=1 Tax=Methanosarcina siciliae T4/M TaxID=1434120 RepID=A0A0E3L9D6_9EURY|nr:cobalt ECF transporter T component CbiQ [Methanosarcina siciliae]AKB30086.1 Transmembrane component NikQ of energizing module of nickel ECF transporter [Methanosarcina siciliae T4/M]